jgi:hypothetical protein
MCCVKSEANDGRSSVTVVKHTNVRMLHTYVTLFVR